MSGDDCPLNKANVWCYATDPKTLNVRRWPGPPVQLHIKFVRGEHPKWIAQVFILDEAGNPDLCVSWQTLRDKRSMEAEAERLKYVDKVKSWEIIYAD